MSDTEILERLCNVPECPNLRQRGYIYCETCLHGSGERAPAEWLAVKKRHLKEQKKLASGTEDE